MVLTDRVWLAGTVVPAPKGAGVVQADVAVAALVVRTAAGGADLPHADVPRVAAVVLAAPRYTGALHADGAADAGVVGFAGCVRAVAAVWVAVLTLWAPSQTAPVFATAAGLPKWDVAILLVIAGVVASAATSAIAVVADSPHITLCVGATSVITSAFIAEVHRRAVVVNLARPGLAGVVLAHKAHIASGVVSAAVSAMAGVGVAETIFGADPVVGAPRRAHQRVLVADLAFLAVVVGAAGGASAVRAGEPVWTVRYRAARCRGAAVAEPFVGVDLGAEQSVITPLVVSAALEAHPVRAAVLPAAAISVFCAASRAAVLEAQEDAAAVVVVVAPLGALPALLPLGDGAILSLGALIAARTARHYVGLCFQVLAGVRAVVCRVIAATQTHAVDTQIGRARPCARGRGDARWCLCVGAGAQDQEQGRAEGPDAGERNVRHQVRRRVAETCLRVAAERPRVHSIVIVGADVVGSKVRRDPGGHVQLILPLGDEDH